MTRDDRSDPLWLKLEAMELDEPGVPVPFSQRLSIENGWTREETAEAIRVYKRFVYLMATTGRRFEMPSRGETVWRLHLTYSRHYRDVLCGGILGFMLHHQPDDGKALEDPREAYRAVFQEDIPHRVSNKVEFDSRQGSWAPMSSSYFLVLWAIAAGIVAFNNTQSDAPIVVGMVAVLLLLPLPLVLRIVDWWMARRLARTAIPLFPRSRVRRSARMELLPASGPSFISWLDIEAFVVDLSSHDPQALVEDHTPESEVAACATERSAREYGKFLYLLRTTGQALTPPLAIDDVWHTHLMSTRSYWEDFCGKHLGGDLHHEPGTGRAGEMRRHYVQYCHAWREYRRVFGHWPPPSHWPYPAHPNVRAVVFVAMPFFATAWMTSLVLGDYAFLPGFAFALAAAAVAGVVSWLNLSDDADYFTTSLIIRSDRSRPSSCG